MLKYNIPVDMLEWSYITSSLNNQVKKAVECIDHMHAAGSTASLLDVYTREWVDKMNSRGLFDVSDEAYNSLLLLKLQFKTYSADILEKKIFITTYTDSGGKEIQLIML